MVTAETLTYDLPIFESYSLLLCALPPSGDEGSEVLGVPTGAAVVGTVCGDLGGTPQFPTWFSGTLLIPKEGQKRLVSGRLTKY